MDIGSRLRALDDGAESAVGVAKPRYDVEPPLWLKYGLGIIIPVMYVLSFTLLAKVGPKAGYAVAGALMGAYLAALLWWTRRHRVRD